MYVYVYGWMDGWMDGLSVALCIFCLVLRKLCKPVKETAKRYKHIELSRSEGLVNEFFGKKRPQNENTGKEQIKKPKINEFNFV